MEQPAKPYTIPHDFVQAFQTDMRFTPEKSGVNGWMTIDNAMLISALRSPDPAVREKFAVALAALNQFDLVLVEKTAEATVAG